MTVSMIPSGQPHGDRQVNQAAAQEAGLETKTAQAPQKLERIEPLRQATPRQAGEFDALESRTPQNTGRLRQSQDSRVLKVMETSPSPALRDLARRLKES